MYHDPGRLKIAHHKHSGRLRPHEYTSYAPLLFLLVIVGVVLGVCTVYAASPPPQSESISLHGSMPGKPPKTAAVITSPTSQQRFSISPANVKGTCPANTLVELFKNDIFAGSVGCTESGTFSIDIDMLIGQNVIIARVYDSLNQPGPDSNAVTIFYDALPAQSAAMTSLDFGGPQLLLNTDAVFRGSFPEQLMNIPVSVIGGTPPYAINLQWGDSTNKVVPRNDNQTFTAEHTYRKAGTYQITLQGTDGKGRVAFLTVAAIVNGQPGSAADAGGSASGLGGSGGMLNKLLVLWPLYTSAVAIVVSFWLGERREKRVLAVPVTVHPIQTRI